MLNPSSAPALMREQSFLLGLCWPAPRHVVLGKPALLHSASSSGPAQEAPSPLTFPSPETCLLQSQSASSQWRKCVQATRLKITVWVGVEWEFRRKCLLLLKRELTSPLSLRARGKWDTKCQLKTSGTTMLQPEPKFLLQPLQVQTWS